MAKVLTERTAFSVGKIGGTAEAPIVEGVLLCGAVSANRRRYLKKAFEGDRVKRYDKVPVGTYHTDKDGHTYLEEIGLIRNPRHSPAGLPIGDIHVNPEKPGAKAFLWDARHAPEACAMSHVASCETTRGSDGWEDVTELVKVESVDVIGAGKAATAKTLFSEAKGSTVNRISLKKFVERFGPKWGPVKWGAAKKLCEDIGDVVADAPVMDEPPADADSGDLKSALMSAITPMLDEAFDSGNSDKVCSAIRDFIKLHAKHTGKAAGDTPEETAAEEAKKKALQPPDPFAVLSECEKLGYRPSVTEAKALQHMTTEERGAWVAEQKQKATASNPTSTSRRPGAGSAGAVMTPVTESAPPQDAKGFAKFVSE